MKDQSPNPLHHERMLYHRHANKNKHNLHVCVCVCVCVCVYFPLNVSTVTWNSVLNSGHHSVVDHSTGRHTIVPRERYPAVRGQQEVEEQSGVRGGHARSATDGRGRTTPRAQNGLPASYRGGVLCGRYYSCRR